MIGSKFSSIIQLLNINVTNLDANPEPFSLTSGKVRGKRYEVSVP